MRRFVLVAAAGLALGAPPRGAGAQSAVVPNAELRVTVDDSVPAPPRFVARFVGLRADTVIVRDVRARALLPLPIGVVRQWEVRDGRVGRVLRTALLGAAAGAFLGAATGFRGATKVNYAGRVSDVAAGGATVGALVGALFGARRQWRTVEVSPSDGRLVAWPAGLGAVPVVERELPVVTAGRHVITSSEIDAADVTTAAEAIRRLRPQFLRPQGTRSLEESGALPILYVDESRMDDLSSLDAISTRAIREIRYYPPAEATTRWGPGHTSGAIQIISRR